MAHETNHFRFLCESLIPSHTSGFGITSIYVICICVGEASWFAAIIYGNKAIRRTRPGVTLWGRETLWNPVNVLLRPNLLTEKGCSYRHKCFLAVAIFIVLTSLPVIISAIADMG